MDNIVNFEKNEIEKIAHYLNKLNILIMPSDTLYGIAAVAYDEYAVKKVFEIKERGVEKKLPIHYHSLEQMENDIEITPIIETLVNKFMPGALTIIAKKKETSQLKFINNTVAVRIPNHHVLLAILKNLNKPLTMPSANKHNAQPALTLHEIQKTIPIPGVEDDINIKNQPSTIFDAIDNKIIRCGIIDSQKILSSLGIK